MGRRGRRAKGPPKKTYDLITKDTDEGTQIYALIASVTKEHKEDLRRARVAAAWMIGKKPDRDGRVSLGRLKKCTELERQLHQLDAIVLLNQSYWRVFTAAQRTALVHHELCHLAPAYDADGHDQAVDGHGDLRWRLVKHDIEEFRAVVATHGCYKEDLRGFAESLIKKDPNLDLFSRKNPPPAEVPAAVATRGKKGAEVSPAAH